MENVLIEMTFFESSKETENKLRWNAKINETTFSLYIPKWRVPEPWPSKILVRVDPQRNNVENTPNLKLNDIKCNGSLRHEPIIATVRKFFKHTKTIRYSPVGDKEGWEIGEPYIPFELTCGDLDTLRVIVFWDLQSRGNF